MKRRSEDPAAILALRMKLLSIYNKWPQGGSKINRKHLLLLPQLQPHNEIKDCYVTL